MDKTKLLIVAGVGVIGFVIFTQIQQANAEEERRSAEAGAGYWSMAKIGFLGPLGLFV